MSDSPAPVRGSAAGAHWRIAVTAVSIAVLQTIVLGLAALPVVLAWTWLAAWLAFDRIAATIAISILLVPSYAGFALCLMVISAIAARIVGLRTPPNAEMHIADMDWRLMKWVQYMVAIHVVRVLAGTLFRGSPIWTTYLRLNGARIGRRVYVNSLALSDYNLLAFGDDVVIGADVHLSGHTVEAGIVRTAGVRLADGVTIGVGAVVGIGVAVGPGSQVGALSLVPKHTALAPGHVYAGIPVRALARLD
jgi:acetyltransferase-like isoleucine patch superfamily enzyme